MLKSYEIPRYSRDDSVSFIIVPLQNPSTKWKTNSRQRCEALRTRRMQNHELIQRLSTGTFEIINCHSERSEETKKSLQEGVSVSG